MDGRSSGEFVSIHGVPGARLQDYRDYLAPIMPALLDRRLEWESGMPALAGSAKKLADRRHRERKESVSRVCDIRLPRT